ncbi:MAG: pyruvate dehydrogenase (acetyl-transferring) E1 component subunit alpha [Flavobacteriales bacterium]|nr:MAG: pyruvate dehydrogenase (acetyl-transferring) E1 component subunit alpha [Flavobacteriales bacterium]
MAATAEKKPKTKLSKKTYLWWYEIMLLMRRFEEKCGQLYIQQKFGGFCHLYIGQEAVLAGMATAMEKGDNVITAYRDHVHPIVLGMHPKYVMAELFGRKTGSSKGKGGSMHMFDKERNLFGGHGIVGGQIPLGAGIAFAEKYKGTKNVTYCFMGDGAVRQGVLHETFNMAMTWKLPVVFLIENNHYAMGTSVERTSNVTDLYQLGSAYNMPSYPIDGMSCEAMHEGIGKAAEQARKGKGPTLIEVLTYRYKGHSMSDPAKYRTKQEVESYKKEDPIEKVLETIKKNKFASDKEIDSIKKKVQDLIEESVKFAEESPYPDGSELYEDVYKQEDYPFLENQ